MFNFLDRNIQFSVGVPTCHSDCRPQCFDDADIAFNSGDPNAGQAQYRGRMSLLQTDLTKNKCSAILRDLTVNDTGFYHPIVQGQLNGESWSIFAMTKKALNVTGIIH